VDRIYLNVPKLLQVVDKKKGTAVVQQTDFKDSIVWNPWIEKGKRMAQKDYGEDEYKEMVGGVTRASMGGGDNLLLPLSDLRRSCRGWNRGECH